jgi:hypothetical protein
MLVLYYYDYCLKFICWVYLTKLHYWITRSGWCGIKGQRGTDGRHGGAAPTTSGRRSTDGRRGGSPPTRRWLLPQDLHHANSTTTDNKFVLLPPAPSMWNSVVHVELLCMDHVWIGFENTCHVLCCKSCCLFVVICSRMFVSCLFVCCYDPDKTLCCYLVSRWQKEIHDVYVFSLGKVCLLSILH